MKTHYSTKLQCADCQNRHTLEGDIPNNVMPDPESINCNYFNMPCLECGAYMYEFVSQSSRLIN